MKQARTGQPQFYLARAGRAGPLDFAARVPLLRPLKDHRVALIGLGAIGAPSALEFARAGVGELRLLDGDIVEPGTTIRWPFGLDAAGRDKATVLANVITANYPYTTTLGIVHRIGAVDGLLSDIEALSRALDGATLVLDATAEVGLQYLLSDLAAEAGIPYLCASSTAGAWGGVVARVRADGLHGCWSCLQRSLLDGRIAVPREDPAGFLQPSGCAAPTFTGAAFDLAEVALMGVRLAVSILCGGHPDAYPAIDWDVGVVTLRDADGNVLPPTWRTYTLRHPDCPHCNSRS